MNDPGTFSTPSLFRCHILMAMLLAIAWSLACVLLAHHLIITLRQCAIPPMLGHISESDLTPAGIQHHLDLIDQKIFDIRLDTKTTTSQYAAQSELRSGNLVSLAQTRADASRIGLHGTGPFVEPIAPSIFSLEYWFAGIHRLWAALNQRYQEISAAIDGCNRALASLSAARDDLDRQLDELTTQRHQWSTWQDHPFNRAAALDTIRGSPWIKIGILAIHVPLLPLALLLAIQSVLRVILLLERLPSIRLVVRS